MWPSLVAVAKPPRPPHEKPNVILIMADDIGWEAIGCYGSDDYETPNIDSLASSGLRFANCFSTPLCTPSRVKLMTGQYNFRNYTHFGYLNPNQKTIGHLMSSAGYHTAVVGKWQLNGIYNRLPGHDDHSRPQQAGFDESYLWQVTTGVGSKNGGGDRYWSPPLERNGDFESVASNSGKYGPDLFCDFICEFMQRNQDRPYFVYYPMVLVHSPFVATPDTIGGDVRTQAANKAPRDKTLRKQNFGAMIEYMDRIVGKIVAKARELEQLQHTIILFTADNGTNVGITSQWKGQAIRGGKGKMTDMGTHVPFVASWHGTLPGGVVLDDLIDFTDFYATLAEAAGATLGEDDPIDGRSFFPQLKGDKGSPREWVLCHYQPYWNKLPGQFARTEDFKLYRDGRFYQPQNDLRESRDLALAAGKLGEADKTKLQALLDRCPPAPDQVGNRDTKQRPVYPDWALGDSNQ